MYFMRNNQYMLKYEDVFYLRLILLHILLYVVQRTIKMALFLALKGQCRIHIIYDF